MFDKELFVFNQQQIIQVNSFPHLHFVVISVLVHMFHEELFAFHQQEICQKYAGYKLRLTSTDSLLFFSAGLEHLWGETLLVLLCPPSCDKHLGQRSFFFSSFKLNSPRMTCFNLFPFSPPPPSLTAGVEVELWSSNSFKSLPHVTSSYTWIKIWNGQQTYFSISGFYQILSRILPFPLHMIFTDFRGLEIIWQPLMAQ